MTFDQIYHRCARELPQQGYGPAITWCVEDTDGKFWVGNDEYSSCVSYCPFCGVRAPTQPHDGG